MRPFPSNPSVVDIDACDVGVAFLFAQQPARANARQAARRGTRVVAPAVFKVEWVQPPGRPARFPSFRATSPTRTSR